MEMYKVSRATARRSLDELMVEGLIFRRQGIGTFVSKSKVVQNLIGEISFNQQIIKQGLTPKSTVIHAELEDLVPAGIANILKLIEPHRTYKIIRVRL